MSSEPPEGLIGRRDEIARLGGVFESARSRRGAVVLLAGEAGVGKTRLAEEVLSQSAFEVFTGRAREEAAPSYGPIASALREYLSRAPGGRKGLGPLSDYLAMLLPELGPPPRNADPDILIESLVGAWTHAAGHRPTALLLDDLHWADNATLELLPVLADRIAGTPLVVLATYRSDEITRGHPVRRLRNELRRARLLQEITVGPMGREETRELLARTLAAQPADQLVEVIFDKTQGIPLYVEELACALISGGRLHKGDGGVALATGEDVPIPESIRDAVLIRMDGLSEGARNQLEIASVVGMEFSLELVTGLAGADAGVEELVEKGFVVETEGGSAAFRHALIREAIRDEIAWSRRRSLNSRIAAYLDRVGAPPEIVVEHWLAANENDPARRALMEIADRSCRLHAYRDAARAGHRALEIWPEGEDDEGRLEALTGLAHCAQVTGQLGEAVRALRELVDGATTSQAHTRRAEALRSLATVYALQGAAERSLETRLESARAFEALGSPADAAAEWLAAGGRLTAQGALDRALDAARSAGSLAAAAARTDLVVRAKGLEGNLLAMRGEPEAGRKLAQEALSLALGSNSTEAAAEAYRRLASVLDYSSDFGGAREAYATAVDYCRAQGDDSNARICLGCMSVIVYRTGDWKRALDVSREVVNDPSSPAGSRIIADAVVGFIRALRGETRRAKKSMRGALALAEKHRLAIPEIFARFGLAVIAELDGETEEASRLHQKVIDAWRGTEDRHDLVPIFLWQATFFGRHGHDHETAERADALAKMASGTGNAETMAALAHALGEVALLAGDAAEASRQLGQALALTEKLEIPLELAVTTWRLGSALTRKADRDGAVRHLGKAYRLARGLGARPLCALIAAELEALGERMEEGRHPDEMAREARGRLTRRQAEIVRLIAEGLTNKEIASKLFVSTRTVDMHVRNLLDRLDCRSRTEAARKAAELGLV